MKKLSDTPKVASVHHNESALTMIEKLAPVDFDCYFLFSCPFGEGTDPSTLKHITFHNDLVFFVVSDSLIGRGLFDWRSRPIMYGLAEIFEACKLNPRKKFILLHEHSGMERIDLPDNLRAAEYRTPKSRINLNQGSFKPFERKINKGSHHWITFNSGDTPHRVLMLANLLEQGLDLHGKFHVSDLIISMANNKDTLAYLGDENTSAYKNGLKRLAEGNFLRQFCQPYRMDMSVIDNYHQILKPLYEDTFLEIIAGSTFFETLPSLSEKELQSIQGGCFNIFINGAGAVKGMRRHGIDVFDDVINHDYDAILDPFDRLRAAISDNIDLLNGKRSLPELWRERERRFRDRCHYFDNELTKACDRVAEEELAEAFRYFSMP